MMCSMTFASDAIPAVILARGLGTRLRAMGAALDPVAAAVADTGIKALMPAADGRPFLDHVLTDLADAGIREVILVVGPEQEAIRSWSDAHRPTRLALCWAEQQRPRGTADAVAAAATVLTGREFLLLNSDNRYPVTALTALMGMSGPGVVGFRRSGLLRGNLTAERMAGFAAIATAQGRLQRIIEKPDAATLAGFGADPLLSMNCWRLDSRVLAACQRVVPSSRGELELTSAIAVALASGVDFTVSESCEPVLDLSRRDDLASVRAALMGHEVRL
jgi:dTDP-glucose pyrophosphorylase